MTTAAVVTLVVAALIVAAAALGLLRVIFHLVAVRKSLTALEGGVQVIVAKTSTVPSAAWTRIIWPLGDDLSSSKLGSVDLVE